MSTATALLPVVRMCDNPDCGGWGACDRIRNERRTMGMMEWVTPDESYAGDEDQILRVLRQELTVQQASDSKGVLHMVPPAEFTVHKGTSGLSASAMQAGEAYAVTYSGPDRDLDDILADSPKWSMDLVQERLRALRAEREAAA